MKINSLILLARNSLPIVIGLGLTGIGIKLIKNEKSLIKRKMELEVQLGLGARTLKGF